MDSKLSTNGSHHIPTIKSTLFTMSKDEWNTKEDAGKYSTYNGAVKAPLGLKRHWITEQ